MRRWLRAVIAVAAVALPAAALAQGPGSGMLVRIQDYPGTTGTMLMRVAMERGFCVKYGIRCAMVNIPSGPLGIQALIAGSIEVAQPGMESVLQANDRGADLIAVSGSIPNSVFTVSARSDLPLPSAAKGYPAIMQDLKGKRIGVPGRGAIGEQHFNVMLREASLRPENVAYVAVGSAATAYGALVSGQVDAVMSWQPVKVMCAVEKTCVTVVDLTENEGPRAVIQMNGAAIPLAVSKALLLKSPQVVDAIIAAAKDAQSWVRDPINLDALFAIYKPLIKIGDKPNSDDILREWLRSIVTVYDVHIDRAAAQRIVDFNVDTRQISKPAPLDSFIYAKAP